MTESLDLDPSPTVPSVHSYVNITRHTKPLPDLLPWLLAASRYITYDTLLEFLNHGNVTINYAISLIGAINGSIPGHVGVIFDQSWSSCEFVAVIKGRREGQESSFCHVVFKVEIFLVIS